jgi:hypothetical protein
MTPAMPPLNRRQFLQRSAAAGAAVSLARLPLAAATAPSAASSSPAPGIVDTNVNLFQWPFRKLKYGDTTALVTKLKKHHVIEAWAGSFEALLHKDMAGVNERLAAEVSTKGQGLLRAFGSVNLAWIDWEDDLRRCHEKLKMPGVRIYPGYQPFDLSHESLGRLVAATRERRMVLQVVFQMEDPRVHHPIITVRESPAGPLVGALKAEPAAKVQLLHFTGNIQGADLHSLMTQTKAAVDISRWEGNGAVGRMLGVAPNSTQPARVPLDRVMFGSHAPYFPLETAILKLVESPLETAQIHAIMQGNARRLLPA